MPVITCIDDLRDLHRRRVPKMFFDYAESGSWTEQTFAENTTDFRAIRLRQRVAVDISDRSLVSSMIGQKVAMPVALAPVGMAGMQASDGEVKAARAAQKAGVPFTLSTMSICSIEDLAGQVDDPFWFQLYVMRDQQFVRNLIGRAKAAECSAMVITLDLQVLGQRHKDLKNGLSAPPRMNLVVLLDFLRRWRWLISMLTAKRYTFGNIVGHVDGVNDSASLMAWVTEQFDTRLDWEKIERLRDMWGGKLILKGVLEPEDAEMAVSIGADAIVVSNHGGRQLDGAISSIKALEPIVRRIGNKCEIHFDGGVRSGQDVLKALALGAAGVHVGRAFIYGLGAMGEAGVSMALDIIRKELDTTMALCGVRDIRRIGKDQIVMPEQLRANGLDWG